MAYCNWVLTRVGVLMVEVCSRCGRDRPSGIADPSCMMPSAGEEAGPVACACGTTRDPALDQRLMLISTLRFVLLEPAPCERRDRMLRVCRGCSCTYFPTAGIARDESKLVTAAEFEELARRPR